MSSVQNVWRQLVQRRLWPVAVLLLAGLVAIPVLLAKDPEPVAATPQAKVDADNELAEQPIVSPDTEVGVRRVVIGKRKNPFAMPEKDDPTETTDKASASVVKVSKRAAAATTRRPAAAAAAAAAAARPTRPRPRLRRPRRPRSPTRRPRPSRRPTRSTS